MQTQLSKEFSQSALAREAEEILRKCVHCGFCTATCPTYQLRNDELDGPRGRIYQIKMMLEGEQTGPETQVHLDRCLTCRSCETTCPSGVEYSRLLDIGRHEVEARVSRPLPDRATRWLLDRALGDQRLAQVLFSSARLVRPLLPAVLKKKVPPAQKPLKPARSGMAQRKMLVLDGCVQPTLTPRTNQAAREVLARCGIDLVSVSGAGCCGSLSHHLSYHERAVQTVKRNIDAWWPHVEQGAEAIVVTATGCGVMVKDYGHFLRFDDEYRERAARIAELTRDLSEVIAENFTVDAGIGRGRRISFHAPCTYQHGLKLGGKVEKLLRDCGFELCPVADAHLCCGSAGTYSVLQPELSGQLLEHKLNALESAEPELIATANVGCQTHLQSGTRREVVHWIELLI